jgi:hypothetical protein
MTITELLTVAGRCGSDAATNRCHRCSVKATVLAHVDFNWQLTRDQLSPEKSRSAKSRRHQGAIHLCGV